MLVIVERYTACQCADSCAIAYRRPLLVLQAGKQRRSGQQQGNSCQAGATAPHATLAQLIWTAAVACGGLQQHVAEG
jgi:hypothetical protein